ncbi:MAG TPA: hypothetical protein VIL78_09165 [Hanamia sp.]
MKKIKVSIFAVIAIVMGIAASAFTVPSAHLTDAWFTINAGADPNLASSYTYVGTSSPCSGSSVLCAIEGVRDGSNPDQPLQSSVDDASMASSDFTQPVTGQVDFKQ